MRRKYKTYFVSRDTAVFPEMTSINLWPITDLPNCEDISKLSSTFSILFICAVIQGEGVRPTSRLLRGVPVRPPPRCHLGAGRRLEDREWRRRRIGVRVGDEDGSEAVGDAQQVGWGGGTHAVKAFWKCDICFCNWASLFVSNTLQLRSVPVRFELRHVQSLDFVFLVFALLLFSKNDCQLSQIRYYFCYLPI